MSARVGLYEHDMNYLAHLYFSDLTPNSCVGQLLPDCMPPRALPELINPELALHIHLHQFIDRFTDTHPEVIALRARFEPPYRRFAGVLIDVFFDHVLAREWARWHDQTIERFAHQVYEALALYSGPENERLQSLRQALITHRWLPGYAYPLGMQRALEGLNRRSRFNTPLAHAHTLLPTLYPELTERFASFFPALQEAVASERARHP